MRILAAFAVLTACATPVRPAAKGGPRGLRMDEHLDVAAQHQELARESYAWPDVRSQTPAGVFTPWVRSWDPDKDHARLATIHRSEAAQLQAAYDEACGERPIEHISVSPLRRHGLGGWNTSTGVIVYLSTAAGSAEQLLADLKCHRAWMMLSANNGMEHCPLDLPGLKVDAHGDKEGITLALAVESSRWVEELQRRTAQELQESRQLRKPQGPR